MARVLSRYLFHGSRAMQAKVEHILSFNRPCRSPGQTMLQPTRSYIQRSADRHESTFCRNKADEADFLSCRHNQISCLEEFDYGSAALKYAGVSDKTRLRLEDPALHLSTSCLHSAIEDLLSVIFDRCCSGIQVFRVILVLSIYLPVLRTPGLYFHGTLISGIEKPQSHI